MAKLAALVSIALVAAAACRSGTTGDDDDTGCTVPADTMFTVSRADAMALGDDCSADVVAGLVDLNQVLQLATDEACGMTTLMFATAFEDASGDASCSGNDTLAVDDLEATGGTGTDVVAVTCDDGTQCTATFDATLTL